MKRLPALLAVALGFLSVTDGLAQTAGQPGPPPRDTAQPASKGTGRLRGTVVAAGTNVPLRRVQMMLQWGGTADSRRITQTDAQGRYEFTGLAAGKFTLVASTPGHIGLQYGQRRPYEPGTSIAVRDGETVSSIDFALPRGSVISGRVTDEFGQPLVQVQVQVRRFQYSQNGQRRLAPVMTGNTDDRGEFRLFGLMPGEYVVEGSRRTIANTSDVSISPTDPVEGFRPTFYPGTPNAAEAQTVSLAIGQEATIQFALIPARLVRVSGTVLDSQGRPIYPAEVQMWTRIGEMFTTAPGGSTATITRADGSFAFAGVIPGDYSVQVRTRLPGALGPPPVDETGSLSLSVPTGDMSGVVIRTSKGTPVAGRVIWEGTAPRTLQPPARFRVTAETVDPAGPGAIMVTDVGKDDDFRFNNLTGRFQLALALPENLNWRLKTVTLDGDDLTDTPIDLAGRSSVDGIVITMTDKVSSLSGSVADGNGKGVSQYVVVVQPTDQHEQRVVARFVRTVRPDTDGRFEIRNIRPGRYVATAIEALEEGRQFAPEFQRELRRGAREFTIKEGEPLTLDLKLTTGF
jgi:protocatechuate 3,4-dioxygenase beta subunit